MVLTNQEDLDKLGQLYKTYGREAINKSLSKYGQEAFTQGLQNTPTEALTKPQEGTYVDNTNQNTQELNSASEGPTYSSTSAGGVGTGTSVVKANEPQNQLNVGKTEPQTQTQSQTQTNKFGSGEMLTSDIVGKTKKQLVEEVPQITTIAQFKAAGGSIDDLSNLIEYAYGAGGDVTVKGNAVYGTKNGVPTKWIIDSGGNPIATSITRDQARSEGVDMGVNMSAQDVFARFMSGQTEGLDTTTSEYEIAKRRFNNYNALDKSEDGIYTAMKNGTFDFSLMTELNKVPQYAQAIANANARIIREKLDNTTVEDLMNMTQMDLVTFVKDIMGKFGLDDNIYSIIEENKRLNVYKDAYVEDYEKLVNNKKTQEDLYDSIVARYPNASSAFINAMYRRQSADLVSEQNDLISSLSASKAGYDLEWGELTYAYEAQQKQDQIQLGFYNEKLNQQWTLFSEEKLGDIKVKQEKEIIKAQQQAEDKIKGYTSKIDKNGDLVFFDAEGKEMQRHKGFSLETGRTSFVEEVDDNGNRKILLFDNITGEYKNSYVIGGGLNQGRIFGGAKITNNGTEILEGDFVRGINIDRSGDNIARDTNNPGNITVRGDTDEDIEDYGRSIGANGTYKSSNGREYYVFPSIEKGVLALKDMVKKQQKGYSSWAVPSMTLEEYIIGYESGPENLTPGATWSSVGVPEDYYYSILDSLDAGGPEEISEFDAEDLANAIAKAEGFGDIIGIDGGVAWTTLQLATAQRLAADRFSAGKETDEAIESWKTIMRETGDVNMANSTLEELSKSTVIKNEDKLRSEMSSDPIVKTYIGRIDEYFKMKGIIASGSTGAEDMALVFSFMKALDPTSVVRESEYAAAAKTSGALQGIAAIKFWETFKEGDILVPEQRDRFLKIAEAALKVSDANYEKLRTKYKDIADKRGLDFDNIDIYSDLYEISKNEGRTPILTDNDGVNYYSINEVYKQLFIEGFTQEEADKWVKENLPKYYTGK